MLPILSHYIAMFDQRVILEEEMSEAATPIVERQTEPSPEPRNVRVEYKKMNALIPLLIKEIYRIKEFLYCCFVTNHWVG
jgi:hypothetical protein